MTVRVVGAMAAVLVCATAGGGTVAGAGPEPFAVFLTLPMSHGFADATYSQVEAQELVRKGLDAIGEFRLVDRSEDADVVMTVLGRGRGDVELNAALRTIDPGVIAPPVPIGAAEKYIEVMLTIGSCGSVASSEQGPTVSCYSRIFVGVGFADLDTRRTAKSPPLNSWEACANALARDVRAWLTTNASRVREFSQSVASR
jgi:hypothetical protein